MSEPFIDQFRKIQESFQRKPLRGLAVGGAKPRPTIGSHLGSAATTSTPYEQLINRYLTDPSVVNHSFSPTNFQIYAETQSWAVAKWIAMHVNAWLRAWPGRQHALVNRVERFDAPGDVYARLTVTVGNNGRYAEFLALVQRIGSTSLSSPSARPSTPTWCGRPIRPSGITKPISKDCTATPPSRPATRTVPRAACDRHRPRARSARRER